MSHARSASVGSDSSSDDEDIFLRIGGDVFDETEANTQKREDALKHQSSITSRTWGSASHEARWAEGSSRERLFALRAEKGAQDGSASGKHLRLVESPGQQMCLWDCSLVLARFLEAQNHLVRGKHVIELGCGLGLPGLVAGAIGAQSVLLTDRPLIVQVLEQEIEMNASLLRNVSARTLEWGHDAGQQALQSLGDLSLKCDTETRSSPGCADTQTQSRNQGFEVVLCSDLVYAGDTANTQLLVDTIVAVQSFVDSTDASGQVELASEASASVGVSRSPNSRLHPDACVVSCYEKRSAASIEQNKVFRDGLIRAGYDEVIVKHSDMDHECQDPNINISIFRSNVETE